MKSAKFLVFDDVNTLFSKDASFLDRTIAAVSLVPVPIGKVLKVAKLGKLGFSANSAGKATRGSGAASNVSRGTGKVQKYEVGVFDDLQKRSAVGDKLDIHHVGQKHPASQVIDGYNPQYAPSIAVPFREHKRIPTLKGDYNGSARDLLAKDIWDLRRHTNAPNSTLKELMNLNKSMYPGSFVK
ncbi:hypothetical protein [Virgibacillus sp. MG-45]|uniref:hypothetical protein n=1 Tax=Virgibacillus sp. MG-45 TaxID=3102791 RepID=UPI002ED7E639